MAIELAITDDTPQPAPGLSDEEILDCFLGTDLNGSYRQYLLNAGRAIEDKLRATLLRECEAILDDAEDWTTYVVEDFAPTKLRTYLEKARAERTAARKVPA